MLTSWENVAFGALSMGFSGTAFGEQRKGRRELLHACMNMIAAVASTGR